MKITARFKAEAASRLFNMKRISPGAGYRFSNCVISTREYLNSTASLIYKTYAASGYMEEDIKNPQTGLMQPYSMAYPIIINSLSETYQAIAPAVFKTYTKQSLSCSSVPSAIYIAISKLKNGNFQEASTTPINFALLEKWSINIGSSITTFTGIDILQNLAISNGYDELESTMGMLIKGFPIKLDLKKDITLSNELVIRQETDFKFSISGSFMNQGDSASNYRLEVITVQPSYFNLMVCLLINRMVLFCLIMLLIRNIFINLFTCYMKDKFASWVRVSLVKRGNGLKRMVLI
jgi:hypothetical protein